jgi:hypothetical protein
LLHKTRYRRIWEKVIQTSYSDAGYFKPPKARPDEYIWHRGWQWVMATLAALTQVGRSAQAQKYD